MRDVIAKAVLALATLALLSAEVQAQEAPDEGRDAIEKSGDILALGIPVAALATTFIKADWKGSIQLVGSAVTTQTVTELMKDVFQKFRPNATTPKSFPSGHSSGAWSGAAFFGSRYGPAYGIPAYTLAAWVSFSRVHAQKHFLDDVVSGAALAIYINMLWVTPYSDEIAMMPRVSGNSIGLSFALDIGSGEPDGFERRREKDLENERFRARWRFEWAFGFAKTTRNRVQSPENTGTTFDMSDFDETSNPTTTADITVERMFASGHEWGFQLLPFERRDFGSFAQPVDFAGQTFTADTVTRSGYLYYALRARYRYRLYDSRRFALRLGGGVQFDYVRATLFNATTYAEESQYVLWPFVSANLLVKFSSKVGLGLDFNGMTLGGNSMFDASAFLWWWLHPRWALGTGFMWVGREYDGDGLANELRMQRFLVLINYFW